jgi:DNA topoisomerase-1
MRGATNVRRDEAPRAAALARDPAPRRADGARATPTRGPASRGAQGDDAAATRTLREAAGDGASARAVRDAARACEARDVFTRDGERKWKVAPPGVRVFENRGEPHAWIEKWRSPKTGKWVHNYTLATRVERQRSKFEDNRAFARALPTIRARYSADLEAPGRARILALVVALIDQAYFRIGNEESDERGVHGITTLRKRHVTIDGDAVRFDYVGKKQVEQHTIVCDARLASMVRALSAACRRPDERVFRDGAKVITAADVNAYLSELGVTAKQFRTFHATRLAREGLLAQRDVPEAARAKAVDAVVAGVAERLGHTAAVCRQHYVDPVVVDAYLAGRLR